MSKLNLFTKLKSNTGAVIFANNNQFPVNPEEGQLAFVEQILYIYSFIGGILTWYPLTNVRNSYIHVQGVQSSIWTIQHYLNTVDFGYFVYDTNNNMVLANIVEGSVNAESFQIELSESIIGKCIVISSDTNINSIDPPESIAGIQGIQGIQGNIGYNGLQGLQGLQGIIGIQGYTGIQGNTGIGLQGSIGSIGLQGIQGYTGIQGGIGVGLQGSTGSIGIQGYTGIQGGVGVGLQGIQGFIGIQGYTGIQGSYGVQGSVGSGIQGIQGIQGYIGIQGNLGIQGSIGSGIQGIQGIQGYIGIQGDSGIQGSIGLGIQGTQGLQGFIGNQGIIGTQGATGIQGQTVTIAQVPHDIATSIFGTPDVNSVVLIYAPSQTFDIFANYSGSRAICDTAPIANTVFNIYKINSSNVTTSIGTITFNASSKTGTFSTTSAINITTTDLIKIVSPANLNGMSDLSLTIHASYT